MLVMEMWSFIDGLLLESRLSDEEVVSNLNKLLANPRDQGAQTALYSNFKSHIITGIKRAHLGGSPPTPDAISDLSQEFLASDKGNAWAPSLINIAERLRDGKLQGPAGRAVGGLIVGQARNFTANHLKYEGRRKPESIIQKEKERRTTPAKRGTLGATVERPTSSHMARSDRAQIMRHVQSALAKMEGKAKEFIMAWMQEVMTSKGKVNTSEIARNLGMSANQANSALRTFKRLIPAQLRSMIESVMLDLLSNDLVGLVVETILHDQPSWLTEDAARAILGGWLCAE